MKIKLLLEIENNNNNKEASIEKNNNKETMLLKMILDNHMLNKNLYKKMILEILDNSLMHNHNNLIIFKINNFIIIILDSKNN